MSIFNEVQNNKPQSNTFDLSHDKKMSMKMGKLVPIHVQEIVPGDSIKMSTSQMLRLAPMIAPVMHNIKTFTHFFFVPNRLLWPNWENFITGGEDGQDTSVFPFIEYANSDIDPGTLADYFGLPQAAAGTSKVSAMVIAAYNKIYNEYYRDQNLITALPDTLIDGDNSAEPIGSNILDEPYHRAWQHDYFTSALPWTQKGPEATIPLGSQADIIYDTTAGATRLTDRVANNNWIGIDWANLDTVNTSPVGSMRITGTAQPVNLDMSENHFVDLSTATASTINDLRRAFKLQEWLELNARGGSRYIETILAHFGVRSSDARLQRPEFLGGGMSPITISEVLQTSSNSAEPTPQGNMAGHGIGVGANNSFKYYAEEHGYIIGIMSIMPKAAYQQGIPKHFLKFDKFDYYWKSFAHIGEQPIQNKELYLEGDATDEDTFGYTPRYAEYKFINSSVHGEFRTSLDYWHMGRIFANQPQLNEDFINCVPTTRIFAVLDAETVYAHVFHRIKAKRLMPYFGSPKM